MEFLGQTYVLDRDRCLVGGSRYQFDLLVGERPHLGARQSQTAGRDALAQHRHAEDRAVAAQPLGLCPGVVRVGQDIGDMDHPPFQQGPSRRRPATPLDGQSPEIFDELGRVPVSLREEEHPVFLPSYHSEVGVTKAASRFNERLQHRLEIESRAADDFEHIGGGGLPLQRVAEFAGTLLHLVEQPHVLNRDHRLVGEGLQELDLSVGEQPGLSAGDRNAPNGTAVSQYRDAYGTAIAADRCHRAKGVVGVRVNIRDLRDTSLKYRASRHAAPTWRRGKCTSVDLEHIGGEAVVRHKVEEMTVKPVDKTVLGVAEPRRALGDHVEYRLDVSQRAADNVEHVAGCCLVFESFAQFLRARLHLVEQPHVLDRDQRLVGKSGDELDLPVRERLDVIALETDDGDHYAVAQQRNPEHRAIPADLLGLQEVVLGITQAIRQVNRFSLNRGSADQRAASRSYGMLKEVFDIVGPDVVGPHQVVFAVLQLEEKGMFRLAQASRCLQDGIRSEERV